MNHHVRAAAVVRRGAILPRRLGQVAMRRYATEPPLSSSRPTSGAFYKSFGSPILKGFLGALFTYQIAYWAWMKLETVEAKHDKDNEIEGLKEELKAAVIQQKEEAKSRIGGAKVAVEEKVEEGKKKGWFGW